eukprot:CAMPEP_0178457586 /NCGR_PEP_ID=MMETSP0689_2-20121128/47092_1 /TAXON_ID=160604 /ORGANISM="Amphidinium massartii, Strain CS-259" /LENGTH=59 /DNA_ID=CAMNT_0020083839 /DNA_START=142 /DNA_END=318 /DNA_ORIENTATION=-
MPPSASIPRMLDTTSSPPVRQPEPRLRLTAASPLAKLPRPLSPASAALQRPPRCPAAEK